MAARASAPAASLVPSTRDPLRGGGEPPGGPTLRTREDARAYIQAHGITHLVAYTFSGTLLKELEARGIKAMTCDKRPAEHDGPHYEGDVMDILDLQLWDAIYFVGPECYQHLRWDRFCLQHKIADGRAYWGGAKVLWCICCPHARMIIVEQPDTIGHDYMDLSSLPGVSVKEMRTSEVGDTSDKFMRLTLVNAVLPEVRGPRTRAATRRKSHHEYASVEEQCRDRSTWAHHPRLCELVAMALPINPEGPEPRDYGARIEIFKSNWEAAGHVAPPHYNDPKGEPPDEATKQYQLQRGVGDPSRRLIGAREPDAPRAASTTPDVALPTRTGSQARRAEPGDQVVASDMHACAASLIERKQRMGKPLTPEQARCWQQLTERTKLQRPRAMGAGGPADKAPSSQGQQPSGHSVGKALSKYEREVLQPMLKRLIDVFGSGNCGFNTLAYSNGLVGGRKVTGAELRQLCRQHATELLERDAEWATGLSVRDMLTASMGEWDPADRRGAEASAEAWIERMARPGVWIDQGAMQLVADMLEVQILYHLVQHDGTPLRVGMLLPRPTTPLRAQLEVALHLNRQGAGQHYVAVVPTEEGAHTEALGIPVRAPGARQSQSCYEPDPALIPTASQEVILLQESEEYAREWTMAATSDQEVQALAQQLTMSEAETPPPLVLLAMEESRGEAERREAAQAIQACLAQEARAQGESEDLILEEEPTPALNARTPMANEDLILSEDSDEEWGGFQRGTPPAEGSAPWSSLQGGELATPPNKSRHLSSSERHLGKEQRSCIAGDGHTDGEPAQASPRVQAESRTHQGTRETRSPERWRDSVVPGGAEISLPQDMGPGEQRGGSLPLVQAAEEPSTMVLVTPYTVREGEPLLLMPSRDDTHFGFHQGTDAAGAQPVVERAESLVQQTSGAHATGFAAGRDEQGTRLVVVATNGHKEVAVARTQRARAKYISSGAALLWCALSALTSPSWQEAASRVAVVTASHFRSHDGLTSTFLRAEPYTRRATGLEAGRADYRAPAFAKLQGQPGTTPRTLMEASGQALEDLKQSLRSVGGEDGRHYNLFADAVQPLRISELAPELLDQELPIADPQLGRELFSQPLPVYETPWLARAPPQKWRPRPGCEDFVAESALDLIDEAARGELEMWFQAAKADAICLEELGPKCDRRHKPPSIAIGQDQVHRCARGYVFDCRQKPCNLLDYEEELSTDWNMAYLHKQLANYPDQRLASNLLQGIRLEADVPLMTVLCPHLVSVGPGYDSVQRTVRELHDLGFSDFFATLPFWPLLIIGQGARVKSLGSAKWRRTSNFSGPHKLVTDKTGKRAVPINEASKSYDLPDWLANSEDQATVKWATEKYAHVRRDPTPSGGADGSVASPSPTYKFPKERKPALANVMRDLAILLHASIEMGEPIFVWVEDAAHYFNQFGYAPEELWKSNFLVSARPEDIAKDGAQFQPGQLIFVSEKRLGFGTYASSNVAQRFSNALTGWTLEVFDRLEAQARMARVDVAWEAWIAKRQPLEQECRRLRPKKPREALCDCTQTRLGILVMYTDDPLCAVVGVDRALRMLQAWRETTRGVNLRMAGADKRQLGGDVEWIGVSVLVALGLIAVPKNKLIRARDALQRTLRGEITFGEYRALVGLLEHLRFVAQLQADATNVLYRPHGREGESQGGPSTTIQPTGLMVSALRRWLVIIMECAGAVMTMVFTADAEERLRTAPTIISSSSDAAGDGRGTPGMGGYTHGHFWRVRVRPTILPLLHITAWETLAACVNILIAARLAGPTTVLAMQVDALLTPYVISNQRSRSTDVQHILYGLLNSAHYRLNIAGRLVCRHLSGDGNVPADYASRGLWEELARLCEQLNVKPILVQLSESERTLVVSTIRDAASRKQVSLDEEAMGDLFVDTMPTALSGGLDLEPMGAAGSDDTPLAEDAEDKPAQGTRRPRRQYEDAPPNDPPLDRRKLSASERFLGKGRRNCADGDGPTPLADEMITRLAETRRKAIILQGEGALLFFSWCLAEQGGGWAEPWDEEPYDGNQLHRIDTHPLCLHPEAPPNTNDDECTLGILGVTKVPSEVVAKALIDRFLERVCMTRHAGSTLARWHERHGGLTSLWIVLDKDVAAAHPGAHHELVTDDIAQELEESLATWREDTSDEDTSSASSESGDDAAPAETLPESTLHMEVEEQGSEDGDGDESASTSAPA